MRPYEYLAFGIVIVVLGLLIGGVVTARPVADIAAGGIGDLPIDDPLSGLPSLTTSYPGPQADTVVAATNTARAYLEIANVATSSAPQVLYCNTNDRPVTIGIGITVFGSTSRSTLNSLPLLRGAVRCRFPTATSGVTVIER